MNPTSQARQEYLRNRVMSATSEQLHLMLLDGAIRFATQGQTALAGRDFEGLFQSLDRAQRIMVELTAGLNRDANPQLVEQFAALYNFIYGRLVNASLQRDANALDEALQILKSQRETWQIIVDKIQRELPAMARPGGPPAAVGAAGTQTDSRSPAVPAPASSAGAAESSSAFVAQG